MTDIFSDDNGNRIVIRHRGPAGRGLIPGGTVGQILVKTTGIDYAMEWANPPNGTGAAAGPASSLDGTFALFDGITGKLLKDSTFLPAYFATKTYADSKENSVPGKGLSQQDFTTTLKNKLDALGVDNYRGTFASLTLLNANVFAPAPVAGDYVIIKAGASLALLYFWDATGSVWTPADSGSLSGAAIASLIFEPVSAALWSVSDSAVFTLADSAKLDDAVDMTTLNSLLSSAGVLPDAYATLYYFSLVGTVVPVTAVSDGTTNMVKVAPTTVTGSSLTGFDSGTSVARLRNIGAAARVFGVEATLTFTSPSIATFVVGIAKNGGVAVQSKVLCAVNVIGGAVTVSLKDLVSLATNDYVEIFIGNTTNTDEPTVLSLSMLTSVG